MKDREELKELKKKSSAELQKLLALNREKMRELRFKVSQKQLKNVHEIKKVKKVISRILTLLSAQIKAAAEKK